jgi:hypothetical protein
LFLEKPEEEYTGINLEIEARLRVC